jgi:ribonuclease P protein component
MTAGGHRFRPNEHLRRPADFDRVFARKCSARGSLVAVYGCENGLPYSRLGRAVGRKWGNAVVRNRVRRWFREAYRLCKPDVPVGLDLVLVPVTLQGMSLPRVRDDLPGLLRKVVQRLGQKKTSP